LKEVHLEFPVVETHVEAIFLVSDIQPVILSS
jgi:hypothetical protein